MTAVDMKAKLKDPKTILRIIELIFSIICFALVANGSGYDKIDFTLFTGITTMLLCLVFIGIYVAGMDESPTIDLFELIINVLWWIFWLAAAACLSSLVSDYNGINWGAVPEFIPRDVGGVSGNDLRASCAFGWLTFFLWTASTVLSIMNTLKGRKSGGAPPAAPAVAMV